MVQSFMSIPQRTFTAMLFFFCSVRCLAVYVKPVGTENLEIGPLSKTEKLWNSFGIVRNLASLEFGAPLTKGLSQKIEFK
jgi:hypothetical protein